MAVEPGGAAPAPELHVARVVRSWDESPVLRGIVFAVDRRVTDAYERPGQYVNVVMEREEAFFALARGPSRSKGELELLVRRGGVGIGEDLAKLPVGADVRVSLPTGVGFPVETVGDRPWILVAAGSGIAPLRAVLHESRGEVSLYYGQRHESEFAYGAELDRIGVVRVASRPSDRWTGLVGHVQDALAAHPPELDGAAAFVCGPPAMVDDLAAWFGTRGVTVHTNY